MNEIDISTLRVESDDKRRVLPARKLCALWRTCMDR